ncbi:MAG TPA: hypothetical protein VGC89_11790 [Pyrinomonadaceae bacterium]|jgi:hypothetical protein
MNDGGAVVIAAETLGGQAEMLDDPLPHVRLAVRGILLSSPAYQQLDPGRRRQMAEAMVKVCHTAARLLRDEIESDRAVHDVMEQQQSVFTEPQTVGPLHAPPHAGRATSLPDNSGRAGSASVFSESVKLPEEVETTRRQPPLASAQSAGSDFSGRAVDRVGDTTRNVLNAVSFPRFVTELINGVFKAMLDSNAQQMNSYVELLNNVAASTDGFMDSNLGDDRARQWLVEKYPASFELNREEGDSLDVEDGQKPQMVTTVQLRSGAKMPSAEALKTDLGLSDSESVPAGDPEQSLVPFARRRLAKMRQEMLATMVMLGMQRIVIESGRISAGMRFHIDARSAAQADQGSSFDLHNQINAAGSYGVGIGWGASASISNTIGYVTTQRSQTTEEERLDLNLDSSVEINFKSDYLPLNRLASTEQANRIRENSRNPEAEAKAIIDARTARAASDAASDTERRAQLNQRLTPTQIPQPAPDSPGAQQAADQARPRGAPPTTPPA